MACPVDVLRWEKANRVTLWPDQLQRWVVALSARPEQTPAQLEQLARGFMTAAFSRGAPRWGAGVGSATNLRVLDISQARPATPEPSQEATALELPPTLRSGPAVFATLQFAWRGPLAEMPWPVHGRGVHAFCPVDADAILVATKGLGGALPPRNLDAPPLGSGALDLGAHLGGIVVALSTTAIVGALAWAVLELERR